jgi:DinB superfamily
MHPTRLLALSHSPLVLAAVLLGATAIARKSAEAQSAQQAAPPLSQRPDVTKPLEDKSVQGAPEQHEPSAAEMSKKETVASAFLRGLQFQEYEVRSATEAMPEEKYSYRPAEGKFRNEKPEFGPAEVRTFAEQAKHVGCSNFAFAAELDGQKPPDGCDKGGPSPAKSKKELLIYLRESFAAIRKSLGAINAKNMFDPIEGPYAGPNTRLGLATVVIWHNADHYGQMTLHLRSNGIVPPASRRNPPALQDNY